MIGEVISIETLRMWQEVDKENEELKKENAKFKREINVLLNVVKKYEKNWLEIRDYIVQNCEIIKHRDYDEIGKVNGSHILYLLNKGDKDE